MNAQRPIFVLPHSPYTLLWDGMAIAALAANLVIALHAWLVLPDRIPVQFSAHGTPSEWGSKAIVMLLPLTSWLLATTFNIIRRYPHTFNYPVRITQANAIQQYRLAHDLLDWLKVEITWFFAYLTWQLYIMAKTSHGTWVLIGPLGFLGLILSTSAYYLWRAWRSQ